MDDGIFAGVDIDWSLWKKEEYIGSISLENLYNVDRYNFEETFFKYDIKVTDKIHLSGMNEWNLGERKYLFGVNDFNYNSSRYQYSLGTRYDNVGNVSGIAGSFQHNVNDLWSYSTSVCYDIDKGSFNQKSFELWKKLHCWELRLKIKKNTDDFSFYIFASPIFL
jgi:hypothetical protein